MSEFTLISQREIKVKEGWGVDVEPIWDNDEGDQRDRIVEIIVSTCHIVQENCKKVGGIWCIATQLPDGKWSGAYVPVENFKALDDLTQDDTHDLRTRWFPTKEAADSWANTVRTRWNHPEPWRNFICLR